MKVTENITLLNTDCMEYMKSIPDKYFDLAVVDPPYGINISMDLHKSGLSCKKNGYKEWAKKDWDSSVPTDEYFIQLFRISKNQVVWGGNYFRLPPTRCWLIWDKGQRNFSFADAELAWTSLNKSVRVFEYSRGKLANSGKIHPTQKPIELYDWILEKYAQTNFKILDTHLGSGSSSIAAHKFGIAEFVGCELDSEYYEASIKRFKEQTAQIKIAV